MLSSQSPARSAVTVKLPAVLVDLFPGSFRRVEVEASTVSEMVDALDRLWPGIKDRICDTRPAIRRHMNVFVDGEKLKYHDQIAPGSEVFVLTAISGG